MPSQLFLFTCTRSPRGHTREPDAVFDDVKERPVAQILRRTRTHVGRRRKHAFSHRRVSAAVVGMAGRAVIGEMSHPVSNRFLISSYRVDPLVVVRGYSPRP